jgi:hypothetical protein
MTAMQRLLATTLKEEYPTLAEPSAPGAMTPVRAWPGIEEGLPHLKYV